MPAADEVFRLQTGTGAECRLFQAFANEGHYRGKGGTRQGIYICTPEGQLLASLNSLQPRLVINAMVQGLEAWRSRANRHVERLWADDAAPTHRWETSYPTDGLVLVSTRRDLVSGPGRLISQGPKWNRDHVWFSKEDALSFFPSQPTRGMQHQVAEVIGDRLARFHLVDNVRGQTLPFAPQEIESSHLESTVAEVTDAYVEIKIEGAFKARAKGTWLLGDTLWKPEHEYARTMEAKISGRARFNRRTQRFDEFSSVALGNWTGKSQFNGRSPDASGLIGFTFRLATPGRTSRIPPALVDMYNADWIQCP